jgi:hypothetical protein
VRHVTRYSIFLQARVSQSGLKTGGGAMTGGSRGTIAEVSEDQVKDGRIDTTDCVSLCYPYFAVFYVLAPRAF